MVWTEVLFKEHKTDYYDTSVICNSCCLHSLSSRRCIWDNSIRADGIHRFQDADKSESLYFLKNVDDYCSVRRVHCGPLCTCSSMATRGSLEPLLHAYVQRDEPEEEMMCASQSEICYCVVFNVVRIPLKKKKNSSMFWFIVAFRIQSSLVTDACDWIIPPRSAAVGEVSERLEVCLIRREPAVSSSVESGHRTDSIRCRRCCRRRRR